MQDRSPEERWKEDEQLFLGSLMRWPRVADEMAIRWTDFYYREHRLIFEAITGCMKKGIDPDAREIKAYDPAIPDMALRTIVDSRPNKDNWKSYETRIVTAANKRWLRETGMKIRELGEGQLGFSEAMSQAEKLMAEQPTSGGILGETAGQAMERMRPEEMAKLSGKIAGGIMTGIRRLDAELHGLQAGDFMVLGGFTNDGKSVLMMNMAVNAAQAGVPAAIITLEDSTDKYLNRIRSYLTGIPNHMFRDWHFSSEQLNQIDKANEEIARWPLVFHYEPGMKIEDIEIAAKYFSRVHGTKILFVDYIQEVQSPGFESIRERMIDVTSRMVNITRTLGMVLVSPAQIGRAGAKMPKLSDLAESAAIERKADIAILIEAEEKEYRGRQVRIPARLHLAKGKDVMKGLRIPIQFVAERLKFGEPAPAEIQSDEVQETYERQENLFG